MQDYLPQEFKEVLEKWKKGEIKGQKELPIDDIYIRSRYINHCQYCGTTEDCDCQFKEDIKSIHDYSWYLQTQITKLEMSLLKTWFVFGIIILLILIFK